MSINKEFHDTGYHLKTCTFRLSRIVLFIKSRSTISCKQDISDIGDYTAKVQFAVRGSRFQYLWLSYRFFPHHYGSKVVVFSRIMTFLCYRAYWEKWFIASVEKAPSSEDWCYRKGSCRSLLVEASFEELTFSPSCI